MAQFKDGWFSASEDNRNNIVYDKPIPIHKSEFIKDVDDFELVEAGLKKILGAEVFVLAEAGEKFTARSWALPTGTVSAIVTDATMKKFMMFTIINDADEYEDNIFDDIADSGTITAKEIVAHCKRYLQTKSSEFFKKIIELLNTNSSVPKLKNVYKNL